MDRTQRNRHWLMLIFQLLVYNECEILWDSKNPRDSVQPHFNWQGSKEEKKTQTTKSHQDNGLPC